MDQITTYIVYFELILRSLQQERFNYNSMLPHTHTHRPKIMDLEQQQRPTNQILELGLNQTRMSIKYLEAFLGEIMLILL